MNPNYLGFAMVGVGGEQVAANFAFNYQGFTISATTIFNPQIAIWEATEKNDAPILYNASSMVDAIRWCDLKHAERLI